MTLPSIDTIRAACQQAARHFKETDAEKEHLFLVHIPATLEFAFDELPISNERKVGVLLAAAAYLRVHSTIPEQSFVAMSRYCLEFADHLNQMIENIEIVKSEEDTDNNGTKLAEMPLEEPSEKS